MGVAHWCLLLWRPFRLQVICQCLNDLLCRTSLEPLLLHPAPLMGFLALRAFSRRRQILADMIEVAQKGSLLPKHLTTLQPNPLRPVCNGVNAAIQSPTRLPRAVSQATPCGCSVREGGPIHRRGAFLSLCCHLFDLLHFSWPFALPLSCLYRSNHGSIR